MVATAGLVVALVALPVPPAGAESRPRQRTAHADTARAPDTRVLIVGDSVAWTLGLSLAVDAARYGVVEQNDGLLGCGVGIQQAVISQGQLETMVSSCNSGAPPTEQWPALWAGWIKRFRPQVVVVLAGRWETADVEIGGHWTSILHPGYDHYVRTELARAVRVASAGGAHVDLLTSPCFDAGHQPDGQPWPESNPARVAAYNRDVRQVAATNPKVTSVFNLFGLVCPGGKFTMYEGGVQMRNTDRIHFPGPNDFATLYDLGRWIGPRMWPALLRDAHRPT